MARQQQQQRGQRAQPPATAEDAALAKIPERIKDIMVPVEAYKESIMSALRRQTYTNITYEDLVQDLKAALRMNFKLRGCDKNSIAACMVYAARRGLSFGEGGVHLVPRKKKGAPVEQCSPIIDFRAKRAICERVLKLRLTVRLVYQAEEERGDFNLEQGLNPILTHKVSRDPEERTTDKIFGGYWFAEYDSGRKEFDFVDMGEINKHAAVSAAGEKGPWGAWREKMIRKTLTIIGANTLMGNYTGGGVDTPDLDWQADSEAIDAEFEEIPAGKEGEGQPQSNAMADDLAARKGEAATQSGPPGPQDAPVPGPNHPADDPASRPPPEEPKALDVPPLPGSPDAGSSEHFNEAVSFFNQAFDNLKASPEALMRVWKTNAERWAQVAGTPELNLITQAKNHFYARAHNAGYPQPE